MSATTIRVRAIYRKEFREYRRNGSIVATMAAVPLGIVVFPLILVIALPAAAADSLRGDPLVILMGMFWAVWPGAKVRVPVAAV